MHHITTIDAHTAGEPLRIVTSGFPEPEGQTMLEKREFARREFEPLRRAIMFEPRGHADMYGCLITESEHRDAHAGLLFLHNEGYSTMCGHAILALSQVGVNEGLFDLRGEAELRLDTPAGRINAFPQFDSGKVTSAEFDNVQSFVEATDLEVPLDDGRLISCDIAFGGAYYAFVSADELDLKLDPSQVDQLISVGRQIKSALNRSYELHHPSGSPELAFIYGTIFTANTAAKFSRHVCVFADGEVDRSPTGTGVSARAALEWKKGKLNIGDRVTIDSIIGSDMTVELRSECQTSDGRPALIPRVGGRAYLTGYHKFVIDPADPLASGFLLR